ncbi:MAG: type 3 dihydrofolate reductase [Thiomicrospira sp.]|jgi:dihydrofolate reductase|nr:type 3 dihydrofolate reductase [Thiomicrospira sp.]
MKKPVISMIVAMAKNRLIGQDNQMPWHLPDDLKYFKAQTLNKPILMGRKTFESIGAKPLPKRRNIVITRDKQFQADGIEIFDNLDSALAALNNENEIMIIGGAQIYQQMLDKAHRLYITEVAVELEGDAYFPQWNQQAWLETKRVHHSADASHAYAFDFVEYQRI